MVIILSNTYENMGVIDTIYLVTIFQFRPTTFFPGENLALQGIFHNHCEVWFPPPPTRYNPNSADEPEYWNELVKLNDNWYKKNKIGYMLNPQRYVIISHLTITVIVYFVDTTVTIVQYFCWDSSSLKMMENLRRDKHYRDIRNWSTIGLLLSRRTVGTIVTLK